MKIEKSEIQNVGEPHEIICVIHTAQLIKSDYVNISWVGPKGVITANENSRITVISTTSDGHIHTSTLQFSYISEEDENTLYSCTGSVNGNNKSIPYKIGSLFRKLNYVALT